MVGKNKKRRRTADSFKNVPGLLQSLINVNRNAGLQRKGTKNCHIFAIVAGQLCTPPISG
jgi:hypothetical protein